MNSSAVGFQLDPGLEKFATERQWEILKTWEEHGTQRAAAEVLGIGKTGIAHAMRSVLKKASLRGYHTEPSHLDTDVPAGFVLKGQSVLIGGDGNLRGRWDKTTQEGVDPEDEIKLPPDLRTIKKISSMRDGESRARIQWVTEEPKAIAKRDAWEAFAEAAARDIPRAEPLAGPKRDQCGDLMVAYPIGDHHLGMLAWDKEVGVDYDLKVGEKLLVAAMSHLTHGAKEAKRALVAFMGDYLHYCGHIPETPTHKNPLDGDSRQTNMAWVSVKVARISIDLALHRHGKVDVVVLPGNHDVDIIPYFAMILHAIYEKDPRVTVHLDPKHYQYLLHGRTLLGLHHGHGCKMDDLPMLMAADCKEWWGQTDFRYWLTGHIHHKDVRAKDMLGCTVESLRILPPTDAWAFQKGYRPMREMVAITYHKLAGEISRSAWKPRSVFSTRRSHDGQPKLMQQVVVKQVFELAVISDGTSDVTAYPAPPDLVLGGAGIDLQGSAAGTADQVVRRLDDVLWALSPAASADTIPHRNASSQ